MSQLMAHFLESKNRTKDVIIDGNITFESLMLDDSILKGLRDCGFKKPSPIQCKSVPVGRCGFGRLKHIRFIFYSFSFSLFTID